MRILGPAMARAWPVAALLAVAMTGGCMLTDATLREPDPRGEVIHLLDEATAFSLAREAVLDVVPGAQVEAIVKPARRHSVRGYAASVPGERAIRSYYEVFVLRVRGVTPAGEVVEGYRLRVASRSTDLLGQAGTLRAILRRFDSLASAAGPRARIRGAERIAYAEAPFAPDAAATSGLPPAQALSEGPDPTRTGNPPRARAICFAVRRDGLLMTAAAPLGAASSVHVALEPAGAPRLARVEARLEQAGLALLRVDARTPEVLALARRETAERASELTGVLPRAADGGWQPVRVKVESGAADAPGPRRLIGASGPLPPGTPLIDEAGAVVAVVVPSSDGERRAVWADAARESFHAPLAVSRARSRQQALERAGAAGCRILDPAR